MTQQRFDEAATTTTIITEIHKHLRNPGMKTEVILIITGNRVHQDL